MAPADASTRHGAPRSVPHGRPAQPSNTGEPAEGTAASRRNEESWVEIASQPSSSSLSSLGDEIVTTGLRVGNAPIPPRRRRLQQPPQLHPQSISMPPSYVIGHAAAHAGTSSQEEYDETESEEDRLLTSSTEQVHPLARHPTAVPAGSDTDSSADENATALGRPSGGPTFRPQPNAFSHPPSHLQHRHSASSVHSYARPPLSSRHSTRPRDFAADNDAALRASLTTLLSCAAAARGLKDDQPHPPRTSRGGVLPSSQPMNLRLVPESELMAPEPAPRPSGGGMAARTASNSSAPSAPTSEASGDKIKRAGTPPQGKPARAVKKKRTAEATMAETPTTTLISPTLLTWVVSAGVVALVVSFGAGFVMGRDVGRQEGSALMPMASGTADASSCGRDLARGGTGTLRRFKWGAVGKSITA